MGRVGGQWWGEGNGTLWPALRPSRDGGCAGEKLGPPGRGGRSGRGGSCAPMPRLTPAPAPRGGHSWDRSCSLWPPGTHPAGHGGPPGSGDPPLIPPGTTALFLTLSYRFYPITPCAGSQPTPQLLCPPGTCWDPPTQDRHPETVPSTWQEGTGKPPPNHSPPTPLHTPPDPGGLCQLGPERGAERGQAVTRLHPEVVTRLPHVTAPAARTRSRPRAAAGSPKHSEFPLGRLPRHRSDRDPASVLALAPYRRPRCLPRRVGAMGGSLHPPGSAPGRR